MLSTARHVCVNLDGVHSATPPLTRLSIVPQDSEAMVDLLPLAALRGPRAPPRLPPPPPHAPSPGVDRVDGQLGLLKSRLFSALESLEGSQILSNLSSRLETALSLSQESAASATASATTPSAASLQSPDEASRSDESVFKHTLCPLVFVNARSFETCLMFIRGLREESASSRDDKKTPAAAAKRAPSSACSNEDHVSRPSLPEACGPDPYEKLHYKMGAERATRGVPYNIYRVVSKSPHLTLFSFCRSSE